MMLPALGWWVCVVLYEELKILYHAGLPTAVLMFSSCAVHLYWQYIELNCNLKDCLFYEIHVCSDSLILSGWSCYSIVQLYIRTYSIHMYMQLDFFMQVAPCVHLYAVKPHFCYPLHYTMLDYLRCLYYRSKIVCCALVDTLCSISTVSIYLSCVKEVLKNPHHFI
jgi:hypothetical protein